VGSQFGPDLTSIGNPPVGRGGGGGRGAAAAIPPPPAQPAAPDLARLQQSILDPNAVVSNTNRYVQLSMRDGSTLNARLLNQDTYSVQVLDFRERLQSIPRTNLRSEVVFRSPMPSYRDKLTNQELADLISYLVTLKSSAN
jgi:hypothetical protein